MATLLTRVNGGALPIGSVGQTLVTGRPLTFYTVSLTNVHVDYSAVDSDFEKLVRAIETISTIELLGTPGAGAFRVAITNASVFVNGAAVTDSTPASSTLEGICNAAVAGTTVASYTF